MACFLCRRVQARGLSLACPSVNETGEKNAGDKCEGSSSYCSLGGESAKSFIVPKFSFKNFIAKDH